jgi:hypothetical protein
MYLVKKTMKRSNLEDLGVEGKIILKWTLQTQGEGVMA